MVEYSDTLDATFAALSDSTRRGILKQLSRRETTVTEVARPYQMSLAAVSKHVQVLERAGLIIRSRRGREHWIRVDPNPVRKARDWCSYYADAWQQQFDALDKYLQQSAQPNSPTAPRRKRKPTK